MTTKRGGNLPFSNPMGDGFELMKKMWGFAGLPGLPTAGNLASMASRVPQQLPNMFAPTLDVNELEKRITDLRAVEQWLELNAGILRTTIQSLEVQRATIATLKGISGAMLGRSGAIANLPANPPPEVALGLAAMRVEESTAANAALAVAPPDIPKKSTRRASKRSETSSAPGIAAPLNPAAWWGTLQDQFTRIAAAAAPAAATTPAKPAKKSAKRRKARS